MKQLTISVIGCGFVGRSVVHLLLNEKNLALRINVMDPGTQVQGSFLDLGQSAQLFPQHELLFNQPAVLAESDYIFHAAGPPLKMGAPRLSVAKESIELTHSIFQNFKSNKDPYIIVISNPVDVIAYHVWKATALPADHILGTGTLLDKIRLEYFLQQVISDAPKAIEAWTFGEHGEAQVHLFSSAKAGDQSVIDLLTPDQLKEVSEQTRYASTAIRKTQQATIFGVASCAMRFFHALQSEEEVILPASLLLNQHYQERFESDELFMSIPASFSEKGIRIQDGFPLSPDELSALQLAAKTIAAHL